MSYLKTNSTNKNEIIKRVIALPIQYADSACLLDIDKATAPEPTERTRTRKKKKQSASVAINLNFCKYDLLRICADKLGYRVTGDSLAESWHLIWLDTGVSFERVAAMNKFQKINHFPGMHEICRKDHLVRSIGKLSKYFPEEYDFFPKSWIIPFDMENFKASSKKYVAFIAKPDRGCQGKDIVVFKDWNSVKDTKFSNVKREKKENPPSNMVIQQYIHSPLLIDGFKFDLRVYVLITSCDPLRIFIYKDGLARFATVPYESPKESNFNNLQMHLTNYAINKESQQFDRRVEEGKGSKRKMSSVLNYLKTRNYDTDALWTSMCDVIIKTIVTIQPQLKRQLSACFKKKDTELYGSPCFEILGFDILLDGKLRPWVLEVNHSPSFTCDSSLDSEVKQGVIVDALKLVNVDPAAEAFYLKEQSNKSRERLFKSCQPLYQPRESEETCPTGMVKASSDMYSVKLKEHEDSHLGNYERIYPPSEQHSTSLQRYQKFMDISAKLFQDTAATKARREFLESQLAKKKKEEDKIARLRKWKSIAQVDSERVKQSLLPPLQTQSRRMSLPSKSVHSQTLEKRAMERQFVKLAVNTIEIVL